MERYLIRKLLRFLFRAIFGTSKRTYKKSYKDYRTYESQNKQKGDRYELQIGKYYQNLGYKVYFKGINEGFSDGGIDLIAYKDNDVLLIQCKNWEHTQVKQEHLRIFLGDCAAYIEQNQKFLSKKNIKRIFITSYEGFDYGVQKFITRSNIEHKIVPYKRD